MSNPKPRLSFSRASRWQIGLDKVVRTVMFPFAAWYSSASALIVG